MMLPASLGELFWLLPWSPSLLSFINCAKTASSTIHSEVKAKRKNKGLGIFEKGAQHEVERTKNLLYVL